MDTELAIYLGKKGLSLRQIYDIDGIINHCIEYNKLKEEMLQTFTSNPDRTYNLTQLCGVLDEKHSYNDIDSALYELSYIDNKIVGVGNDSYKFRHKQEK